MRSSREIFIVAAVVCLLYPAEAAAKVVLSPLMPATPPAGVLFEPSDDTFEVVVRDERPDRDFIAAALLGPAADEDKGIHLAYATETEDGLVEFLTRAAEDAVGVLGRKVGEGGYSLEIVVTDFRIDMYRVSGFSPMNCMAYGFVDTSLKAQDGGELLTKTLKVTFYENTVPVGSMKEVASEALSRIYQQAMWRATADTLIEHFDLVADPAEIQRAVDHLGTIKAEIPARQAIFWLALTRHAEDPVRSALLTLFRDSDKQRVHQAAVEAIGMLGITEARDDIYAFLSGEKKFGGWELDDQEHVWYMLNALALLGDQDLEERIPDVDLYMRETLTLLIAFHENGTFREIGPNELAKIEKSRQKLAKKLAKQGGR
jgi:hypothetical protein